MCVSYGHADTQVFQTLEQILGESHEDIQMRTEHSCRAHVFLSFLLRNIHKLRPKEKLKFILKCLHEYICTK